MNAEQFKKYRRRQSRLYIDSGEICNNCNVPLNRDETEVAPVHTPPGRVHINKAECADLRDARYR
jgi:hypothetical protein